MKKNINWTCNCTKTEKRKSRDW